MGPRAARCCSRRWERLTGPLGADASTILGTDWRLSRAREKIDIDSGHATDSDQVASGRERDSDIMHDLPEQIFPPNGRSIALHTECLRQTGGHLPRQASWSIGQHNIPFPSHTISWTLVLPRLYLRPTALHELSLSRIGQTCGQSTTESTPGGVLLLANSKDSLGACR